MERDAIYNNVSIHATIDFVVASDTVSKIWRHKTKAASRKRVCDITISIKFVKTIYWMQFC